MNPPNDPEPDLPDPPSQPPIEVPDPPVNDPVRPPPPMTARADVALRTLARARRIGLIH